MILQIPADVTPSCRRRRRPAGRSLTGPSWRSLVSPTIEPRRRRWSLLKAGRNLKMYFSFSPVIYFRYNRTKLRLLHPQNNQSRLLAFSAETMSPTKALSSSDGRMFEPFVFLPVRPGEEPEQLLVDAQPPDGAAHQRQQPEPHPARHRQAAPPGLPEPVVQ